MMGLTWRRIWPHSPQERGVFWSLASDFANSVFGYLAMTYSPVVILFLSELGLSKTQIGSIGSLLPFSGLLALFMAPVVARWGLKRTYLTCWGIRKGVTLLLVCTPWVLARGGVNTAFAGVAGVIFVFAICRAIGETAYNPWSVDFVPSAIRGKYGALVQVISTLGNLCAVGVAAFVMGRVAGLDKYVILIVVGVVFGVISVWWASNIPRETSAGVAGGSRAHFRTMLGGLRNADFLRYLAGYGLTLLAAAVTTFLPLFLKEKVGLSASAVVTLQTGTLLGTLISGFLWGWLADRYGSRPVIFISLILRALTPLCWLFMPRHSAASLLVGEAIAFLDGASRIGFVVGAGRLLYVRIVPPAQKTSYLALYYSWIGLTGGIAPLAGGRILDALAGVGGRWGVLILDAYTYLFLAGAALFSLSLFLFSRVQSDRGSARREGGAT